MSTTERFTNLTAMKLLRLGYVLLSGAVSCLGLFVAVWADHFWPDTYPYWMPIVFLSFVSGMLTAVFWLLRLIWLFVAYDPQQVSVSHRKLEVTFVYLAILISFEIVSYIILY
ncbi:hypothetical protein GO755_34835 [Spirosoma sp. HMF4905]|uniref:Uncharacterized protein n=1 Tax=Spirosoma arboris TaxID=2682092 RepID=A0A7K1SN71_9BACT|nr:hypothetical protein [Spirosoma arboris]MVM35250.1 hypothetical protein [Spirosoma arboris]